MRQTPELAQNAGIREAAARERGRARSATRRHGSDARPRAHCSRPARTPGPALEGGRRVSPVPNALSKLSAEFHLFERRRLPTSIWKRLSILFARCNKRIEQQTVGKRRAAGNRPKSSGARQLARSVRASPARGSLRRRTRRRVSGDRVNPGDRVTITTYVLSRSIRVQRTDYRLRSVG